LLGSSGKRDAVSRGGGLKGKKRTSSLKETPWMFGGKNEGRGPKKREEGLGQGENGVKGNRFARNWRENRELRAVGERTPRVSTGLTC